MFDVVAEIKKNPQIGFRPQEFCLLIFCIYINYELLSGWLFIILLVYLWYFTDYKLHMKLAENA